MCLGEKEDVAARPAGRLQFTLMRFQDVRFPRRRRGCTVVMVAVAMLTVLGGGSRALAHADLLLQIEDLTKEIAKKPNDPELYLRRGELRRAHVEWDEAFVDFERAAALAPDLPALDLVRGRLFLDSGWPLSARGYLDRVLHRQPTHVEAFILRGRAFARLHLPLSAAEDFDRALALYPDPGPDLFIERAQILEGAGPEYVARALAGLDDGIRKLGPLVTLQLSAIELEVKTKSYDSALGRVDKIAERSPRKETWLARKGEILKQAGRAEEAREAFRTALVALRSLPATRRNVPAMLELEKRLRLEIDPSGGR